ncbi:MAG: GNAT family N-acetyltransferase [Candidatus Heimdallarchaeota archaeon]|nr:GNAT family N-acetyltransferase [Candidatus Heimdallarchaeota archaeon]
MISTIQVRSPSIDDLNAIVAINRKSLPENYPVAYFIDLIQTWKDTSSVVLLDGKVVGYLIMRLEGNRSFFSRNAGFTKGHIISVAVLNEHRRLGLGRKMMEDSLAKTKAIGGIESIELEVRESNIPAIEMYFRFNFIKAKLLTRYYADGENAVLMTLDLTQN